MIAEYGRVMIHLTYKSAGGKDLIACIGEGAEYKIMGAVLTHPGLAFTGEVDVVTCPACKKTAVFHEVKAGAKK